MKMISIIIPVYNIANYIENCVNSILEQTYENYEILLIDDGSKDESGEICERIASGDHRVKVFHKPNGGLSDARNYGVEKSKGEYLIFIDGDDFWKGKDSLELLAKEYSKTPDFDFLGFNCQYFFQNKNKYVKWPRYSETINKTEAIESLVGSGLFPMSACIKIIRKDFFIRENLFFEKGRFSEDILWFIEMLGKTNRFRMTNIYMYCYRQNVEGSITSTFSEKKFLNLLDIIQSGVELVDNLKFNNIEKRYLKSFLAYELCIVRANMRKFCHEDTNNVKSDIQSLYHLMQYTKNPKVKLVHILDKLLGYRIVNFLLSQYLGYSR